MSKRRTRTRREWFPVLQRICKDKKYKLVGKPPLSTKEKLIARCYDNHEDEPAGYFEWNPTPESLLSGKGCPCCAGIVPVTKKRIQKLCDERDQKFVRTYITIEVSGRQRRRVVFQCNEGHERDVSWDNFKKEGTACWDCVITTRSIPLRVPDTEVKKLLDSIGYTFVRAYMPEGKHRTRVAYICVNGHAREQNWSDLKSGRRCRDCARKRLGLAVRVSDDEIKELLSERGHTFVRSYMVGKARQSRTQVVYICNHGHPTEASWGNLQQGMGCGECSPKVSRNQRLARQIIEHLTGCKTPTGTPPWLEGQELDGYCEECGWAWEYDGPQHFHPIAAWGGEAAFELILERDAKKNRKCREQGILLWRIDYRDFQRLYDQGIKALVNWIAQRLQARGIETPNATREFKPDLKALYALNDFVDLSGFRAEVRYWGITAVQQYKAAYEAGLFRVNMPAAPNIIYEMDWSELFQKTSKMGDPWQYADEHDLPADLKDHPNANVRRLPSGKRRPGVQGSSRQRA